MITPESVSKDLAQAIRTLERTLKRLGYTWRLFAQGGRIGYAQGSGIMDLGGLEKDYRTTGGFVPIRRHRKKR